MKYVQEIHIEIDVFHKKDSAKIALLQKGNVFLSPGTNKSDIYDF